MREYKLYLKDILEAINKIQTSFVNIDVKLFKGNVDLQDATLRRLQLIGEAVKNIPSEIKKKFNNVEWKKIAGFRDVVTHAYFNVDLDIVWDIVNNNLPLLKLQIESVIKSP